MSSNYQILKVPVSKEKQVFYYFRRYKQSDTENIVDCPPESRSIYVVHFLQPIEESFLLRTFGHAGKVKKTIIGMFKPKSKKKQRRTLYFAIVVFKNDESVDKILGDSKFLQGKVNRHAKKQIGFMANPFLAGEQDLLNSDSEAEEEVGQKNDKAKMEEGGFTLVE